MITENLKFLNKTYKIKYNFEKNYRVQRDKITILIPHKNTPVFLEILLESLNKFTITPWEAIVVDVSSKNCHLKAAEQVVAKYKNVKFICHINLITDYLFNRIKIYNGSMGNAIGLQIGASFSNSKYAFACHCDTMLLKHGWDKIFLNLINDKTKAIGVSHDQIRIGAVHASGIMFDLELFKKLNGDFFPVFEKGYKTRCVLDVADMITAVLHRNNYKVHTVLNTLNNPSLKEKLIS